MILTDWEQIKEYPLEGFKSNMKHPIVLDGRNCYRLNEAETAGLTYVSMGRRIVAAG